MARYVLFRLIQLLPVLLLASVGVWLMIYLIPGDPAIALLGPEVTPEQLARARALMGLDRPLSVQYALWLGRVVRGDLGVSYLSGVRGPFEWGRTIAREINVVGAWGSGAALLLLWETFARGQLTRTWWWSFVAVQAALLVMLLVNKVLKKLKKRA